MENVDQSHETNGTKWDQVTVDAFGVPRRRFHIGDVLSITTEPLVSPRLMEGVSDILGFMTGERLHTHELWAAAETCRPYLEAQFPRLSRDEMRYAVDELKESLRLSDNERVVREWLARQMVTHGASVEVMPLQGKPSERWTKEAARG